MKNKKITSDEINNSIISRGLQNIQLIHAQLKKPLFIEQKKPIK
jgi:hypothetical protein